MGRTHDEIDKRLAEWLLAQPVFFVATAPLDAGGSVNCSPKGNHQELAVLGARTVAYVDQTGSGVETIAHLRENGRIVLMFCSFDEGAPRIVRLHGSGRVVTAAEPGFAELAPHFPTAIGVGTRSVIVTEVRRIADSCGYGVPLMRFDRHRRTLAEWAERKGPDGVRRYWAEKNARSIDRLAGLPPVSHPTGADETG